MKGITFTTHLQISHRTGVANIMLRGLNRKDMRPEQEPFEQQLLHTTNSIAVSCRTQPELNIGNVLSPSRY
ncbi:hypothetical protein MFFC18_47480 [Mariniblastus fucicola]|uniref:Uncharacterized protein n=1 Tax=Mariniblastus fucicola TaxID=980251 RepID=A0A5B9PHR4_9BACT|nr:hypothetical protein MFFC18_47480 [Mariniblastus fucicola]